MSSYLLQPDGSSTCCDCPDRVSPCDDCVVLPPAGCSITASCTFQSLVDEGSSGYIFELFGCGLWPDFTSNQWELDGVSGSVFLPFVGTIIGVDQTIQVVWQVNDDDTVDNYFIVNGVESEHLNDDASLFDDGSGWSIVKVGSLFPVTVSHRTITDFTVSSSDTENYPTGIVFAFPPPMDDPHYDTIGAGLTISGTTITVHNNTNASVYLKFDYCPGGMYVCHPAVPLRCCCSKYMALLDDITTVKLDFTLTGLCHCGDLTQTMTWNRVDEDTEPGDNEFRFYCGGDGQRLQFDAGAVIGGVHSHGPGLDIDVSDYPNAGDSLQIDVEIGVFAGPPDFDQPICGWSVRPCIISSLACISTPAWSPFTTYPINQLVSFLGSIYISLQNGNLNHSPATETAWWTLVSAVCACTTSPDFCLDTTLLAIEDVPGAHVYSDTRSCSTESYDISWTITFS